MKFILTKKQFDFLITLDNVNNFILKRSSYFYTISRMQTKKSPRLTFVVTPKS